MAEYAEDKMCTCGCPASEHHQSWYPGGGHEYGECEMYGSNECGGMKWSEPHGMWIDHCQHFTPVAIPMGPVCLYERVAGPNGNEDFSVGLLTHDPRGCAHVANR